MGKKSIYGAHFQLLTYCSINCRLTAGVEREKDRITEKTKTAREAKADPNYLENSVKKNTAGGRGEKARPAWLVVIPPAFIMTWISDT